MKRAVVALAAILFLLSVSSITGLIQVVKAEFTPIYINADGSISPSTAPIYSADNITYTLTANMTYPTFNGIFVERSNIAIDGNSYTLQGNQSAYGISWANNVNNVTIKNTNIEGFFYGVEVYNSSDNSVCDCNITNNGEGIELAFSSSNKLNGNDVANNVYDGIVLGASDSSLVGNNIANNEGYGILIAGSDNGVVGNNIANNLYGIYFSSGANNVLYHNDFVRNNFQVFTWYAPQNTWDNGYPSGGNYWSDHNGTDLYSGPYQNVTGSDGIGDTPYVNPESSDIDRYPLMGEFSDFNVAQGVDVQVVSNSTVSDFRFDGRILFNVSGMNGTTGFCTVCVPTSLFNGSLIVFVNGTQVQYSLLPASNSTNNYYLYFTFAHSTEQVTIMPEFPTFTILPLFIIATLVAISFYKKKTTYTKSSSQAES